MLDPLHIGDNRAAQGRSSVHAAYIAAATGMAAGLRIGPSDRILTALPLYHANPQFYALATALVVGASVALLDRFVAETFMRDAARLEATGFTYVGTILAKLAIAGGGSKNHPVRFCVGGGAPRSSGPSSSSAGE